MRRLGDVSLRTKLIGLVTLVTFVALGGAFAFVVLRDVKALREEMAERTVLIARVVGDYSAPDLVFRDRKASEESLALLRAMPDLRYAALYDVEGALFSSYRSGPGIALPPYSARTAAEFRDGLLHVNERIAVRGEGIATLALGVSTAALDGRIRAHLLGTAGAVALILGVAILLALGLGKLISEPLTRLVETARRISRSPDYSVRVLSPGSDELGALTDAFNEMLGEIQRREQDREKADRRSREKSLFLAHMSHELRTPLNSIIGFSDVLLDSTGDRLSPKERRFLENVGTAGRHLLRIINTILDLSKIESGRMEVEPETFSLGETVEGVASVLRAISVKRGVALDVELAPDVPRIRSDEMKVKEILYNLISNAVKFSPDGSTVVVTARPAAGPEPGVEIAVRDQGIGIDPKHHELIFQEFRQVDAGEARRFEGTGLGLVLVRRYAELLGGTVRVESALGAGSTFTVRLPLRLATTAPETAG